MTRIDSGNLVLGQDPEPLLLTVDEVAMMLGLSRRTVWRLRSKGQIPAPVRIGRSVRWRRADVLAWVAMHGRKDCHVHTGAGVEIRYDGTIPSREPIARGETGHLRAIPSRGMTVIDRLAQRVDVAVESRP